MNCKNKVYLFDRPPSPNRRMTSKELQEEKWLADAFCRPMRYFTKDPPFYPWLPITPLVPHVNFDLNYKE